MGVITVGSCDRSATYATSTGVSLDGGGGVATRRQYSPQITAILSPTTSGILSGDAEIKPTHILSFSLAFNYSRVADRNSGRGNDEYGNENSGCGLVTEKSVSSVV